MKSLLDSVKEAREKGVAIGHFNISDSEGFKAVVEGAKELGVPVIIGVSEGERDFIGLKEVVAIVEVEKANGLPIFLNADHTYSVEKAKVAIDAGVDSVIIDAADKNFEENVQMTKEIVDYAHSLGREVLVEAELGFIGKSSNLIDKVPDGVSEETQTKPEEALEFVKLTGIDMLAPSVGNVHGIVKSGEPKLNIERIKKISETVSIPLVLHGGSGNQDQEFLDAIAAGISIIHINTELRVAYKKGVEEGLKKDEVAPYKFMAEGVEGMKKVVMGRLKLFNRL